MKYVVLIRSNPQPWGHPTVRFTETGRAMPPEQLDEMDRGFDAFLEEISASGELVSAEALGDPTTAKLYRWRPDGVVVTDGPYAEAKEELAGFFIIDPDSRERAEAIAERFAGPGDTIELRPAHVFDA